MLWPTFARWRRSAPPEAPAEQADAQPVAPAEQAGAQPGRLPGRALTILSGATRTALGHWWWALPLVAAVGVVVFLGRAGALPAPLRWLGSTSGPDLYLRNCAECHGAKGSRIPAIPLDSPAYIYKIGETSLAKTITDGKGTMPAWGREQGGPLGDEEIRTLVVYLTAPERFEGRGRRLYLDHCAMCHGEKGGRVPAAPLNSRQYLDQRSDADLVRALADGQGTMPAFGRNREGALGDDELAAVARYVRLLAGSVGPAAKGAGPAAPGGAGTAAPVPSQALKPVPGSAADLFKANCAVCHASLSLPRVDPTQIHAIISEGQLARGMPAFGGKLAKEDIEALAQLIAAGGPESGATGTPGPFSGVIRHVDGWIVKHPAVVQESGAQLCYKCHQNVFCATCHTGGRAGP